MMSFRGVLIAAVALLAGTAAQAQEVLHDLQGASGSLFGWSVAAAGDIDHDGHDDLIVGARQDDTAGRAATGSATVYSGRTGAMLFRFEGGATGDLFGYSVAGVGDLDGDGTPDLAVGAPRDDDGGTDSGTVTLYSGLSGAIMQVLPGQSDEYLGWSLARVGDTDLDGVSDFVVGSLPQPLSTSRGIVTLFSGRTLTVITPHPGDVAGDALGYSVGGAGDVDGDGVPDVIAGATQNFTGAGKALVLSGIDLSVLHELAVAGTSQFGFSVAGAGDLDDDGYGDLIVGAPFSSFNGLRSGGAWVFSGRNGSPLRAYLGPQEGDQLGRSVARVGDLDGDGHPEYAISALMASPTSPQPGVVFVHRGASGSIMFALRAGATPDGFGHSVSTAGDVNADGFPDLVAGDIAFSRVVVFSGKRPVVYLQDLAEDVVYLSLPSTLANGLITKLDQAAAVLEDENDHNDHVARNKLGDFISQVQAAVNSGQLAPEDGDDLIFQAEAILALL